MYLALLSIKTMFSSTVLMIWVQQIKANNSSFTKEVLARFQRNFMFSALLIIFINAGFLIYEIFKNYIKNIIVFIAVLTWKLNDN